MPMPARTTWILVADGARAQIYINDGPGKGLRPAFDHEFAAPTRAPARDAESDRPGRAFDSAGQGRHAMEPPTDWKTHEKQVFAKSLADELRKAATHHQFDDLVVVAPPQTLGDLRDALDKTTRKLVTNEIIKDLTHLDVNQLTEHLRGAVPM